MYTNKLVQKLKIAINIKHTQGNFSNEQ